MRMEKVRLTTLSEAVRSFLARARKGRGLLVEDEAGRVFVGVIPYEEAPPRRNASSGSRTR
jgi:hypothetical protein